MSETLSFKIPQRLAKLRSLLADDMRTKIPIWATLVAFMAKFLGQIENNRHWQAVIFARQRNQRLARLRLNIRGINDCQ